MSLFLKYVKLGINFPPPGGNVQTLGPIAKIADISYHIVGTLSNNDCT